MKPSPKELRIPQALTVLTAVVIGVLGIGKIPEIVSTAQKILMPLLPVYHTIANALVGQ